MVEAVSCSQILHNSEESYHPVWVKEPPLICFLRPGAWEASHQSCLYEQKGRFLRGKRILIHFSFFDLQIGKLWIENNNQRMMRKSESSVVGHSVASTPGGNQRWKLKTVDVRGFFYGPICWYHLVPGCGQPQTKPPIGKGLYGVIAFISCEFAWWFMA